MVRHTEAVDDESTTTTEAVIEAAEAELGEDRVASIVDDYDGDVDAAADAIESCFDVTVDEDDDRCIDPDDVDFDPHVIAAAWEAFDDGVPVPVAVAITNEFTDHRVAAYEGEAVDRDVVFGADESNPTGDIHFEEKAVGVCPRDVAEEHAPAFVDLPNRDDGYVLAVNPAQIFG